MKGRYVIKKSRKFIVSLIIAVFLVGIFPTNISTVTAMEKEISLDADCNIYSESPYNLLENAKLQNYKYVKYYKKDGYLICEMQFDVFKKDYVFYYYFDKNDKLHEIYKEENGKIELYFSKENEILKKTKELKELLENSNL